MTPTKLLIGQILIVLAIVLAGVWIATQWAAVMLAYQPQLGPTWFMLGDILDVPDVVGATADLQQGIVAGGARVRRIEQQAMGEAGTPACRQGPVLPFDVVDDRGPGPRQQSRHHQTNALARPRRRKGHDMLGSLMTQIMVAMAAEHDAGRLIQSRPPNIPGTRPARGAIGRHLPGLARAP